MRAITLIFVLFLGACGFSPIYAKKDNGSVQDDLNQIDIALIPDRSGQFLRNELIDRFYKNGYPSNPRYQLKINPVVENIFDFDITQESDATRQQIRLNSTFELIDLETNQSVLKRPVFAVTSNNILESEFATRITEQSARDAALNDMARQIERQLSLYFNNKSQ